MKMDVLSALIFLTTALFPLYIFDSGSLQPAHWFAVLTMLYCLRYRKIQVGIVEIILLTLVMCAFVAEARHINTLTGFAPLVNIAFIVFSVVFIGVFKVALTSRQNVVFCGLLASQFVVLFGLLQHGISFSDSEAARAVGFFNNPNQLGYFAVLSFSLCVFLKSSVGMDSRAFLAVVSCSIVFAILSLSKAAMLSLGFGVTILFWRSLIGKVVLVTIASIFFSFSAVLSGFEWDLNFITRLASIGESNDDNLSERGTFILFIESRSVADYLFGVGYVRAFAAAQHEIHSTFFSFLGYYGIVGFLLYAAAILVVVLKLSRVGSLMDMCIILGPPILYGMTHNGSRALFFLLLISLVLAHERTQFDSKKLTYTVKI